MDVAAATNCYKLSDLDQIEDVFAAVGESMRAHKGRSVVRLQVDGKTHFLKRFWLAPSQLFKGHVRRGFHELRIIDWLNTNGFAGPVVVRRGWSGVRPLRTRMYFLMEEIRDELPLEAAWATHRDHRDALLHSLACFSARLHDAGFLHTDYSERHILVGQMDDGWTFRLIDLERASLGRATDARVADDLATLSASVMNERLRKKLRTAFLDDYAAQRKSWPTDYPIRALVEKGKPTKAF
ncbi:MAG: hypothetical protein IIC02_07455 [Planctomycetes bacterium]|nr:hypothetical protein [Planctomycetota bacterium]